MKQLFVAVCLMGLSCASFADATVEDIKTLSQKLAGGEYMGVNSDGPCKVSVIDNGGDGTGYSVAITPSKGSADGAAVFTITPGPNGQVGEVASSKGINYIQTLFFGRIESGSLYVSVTNRVQSDRAFGRCELAGQ